MKSHSTSCALPPWRKRIFGFLPSKSWTLVSDTGVHQHMRDPVLHQAGTHPRLAIGAAAVLDDDAGNAGQMQQMRQHQACRARADDADLRAHGSSLGVPMVRRFTRAAKGWMPESLAFFDRSGPRN